MDTRILQERRGIENTVPLVCAPFKARLANEAAPTWSAQELFRRKDFRRMTPEELRTAKRALEAYREQLAGVASRPLLVVADVSAPVVPYSRMLFHFVHAVASAGRPVHAFACSTRLASVTLHLRHPETDAALEAASASVSDWAGGARMGECLGELNRRWSRIVQGARVLLITHGLNRDTAPLSAAMERLHKSCAELIWLNPLLRRATFAARAVGIESMLPHVDHLLPVHNLRSLETLALILREPGGLTTC